MSILAPWYLVAALAATGVAVVLHLLVRRRPPSMALPTARFIPDAPVSARAIARRPADALLLALRVGALVLAGLALAAPAFARRRNGTARVVVVDLSRGADRSATLDSARAYVNGAAVVLVVDSVAVDVTRSAADTLAVIARSAPSLHRGSLTASMLAALRAVPRAAIGADSVSLTIVSPALEEERDRASAAVRALWPGRIDVVRTPAAAVTVDSSVRVLWADSAASTHWRAVAPANAGALLFGDMVLVAPLVRRWRAVDGDSSRVVARWVDGEPAVLERRAGAGCVREVGVTMPAVGDVLLRPEVERFVDWLGRAPCGAGAPVALGAAALDSLRGRGRLARGADFPAAASRSSALAPWLLIAVLLLLAAETLVRGRVQAQRAEAARLERAA